MIRFGAAGLLLVCLLQGAAWAHKPSDSYLRITAGQPRFTAEWDIALKDLDFLIGLDTDQSSTITWGEVKAQSQAIIAHALSHLRMTVDGQVCDLQVTDLLAARHSDGGYAVLAIETDCPGTLEQLQIEYSLLFDIDPTHRGLVLFSNNGAVSTNVLSPTEPTLTLRADESSMWHTLWDYIVEGVWHIWIGFDHILFLLSLLLPAVLVHQKDDPQQPAWRGVDSFAEASKTVLKIVTVFTLAHSITLWLAVMEYVTLPGWIVEATIAFSIIVTAANNLYPVLNLSGWMIAFVFGLVHGFGFANVLVDLGLSSTALAVSLLGFNVGVELGQLAIVLAFLPLAYGMRNSTFYRVVILRFGSIAIAVIAALWMIERVGNVEILGF